jgi:hypothetical protein
VHEAHGSEVLAVRLINEAQYLVEAFCYKPGDHIPITSFAIWAIYPIITAENGPSADIL